MDRPIAGGSSQGNAQRPLRARLARLAIDLDLGDPAFDTGKDANGCVRVAKGILHLMRFNL